MMRALALLLLIAAPAAAQDFAYDPALLTSCLQTNAAKPDSCIGAASKVCLEGEGGSTTVGTVSCLAAENAQWDAMLNTAYEAVLAEAESTDAELKELDRFVRNHTIERFGPMRSVARSKVVEVAFEGLNRSSRHKSGVAMRFPRINRIRDDKPAAEADHLETLQAMLPPEG